MNPISRVLMIEDNKSDARLVQAMVSDVGGDRFHLEHVSTLGAGLDRLNTSSFDLILLDLNLPDSVGLETYSRVRTAHTQIPVILMTGLSDESLAVQAVREGVQDYLVKGRVDGNLLVRAMLYAIERRQMEARLRIADRMVSVGVMAAGVAHEINNPLTYVLTTLNLLDEQISRFPGKSPQELEWAAGLKRLLKNAEEGSERVRRIVGELKTFSRVGDLRPASIDVYDVMESAIQMVVNQLNLHARLVRDYAGSPFVLGNADRLAQVFVNLLINAVQAIPEGAADKHEIAVRLAVEENNAIIEIRDSGVGIPAEQQTEVFKPFFTTRPVGVGTGLGLSICYQIISEMSGQISFKSEPGQGTTFKIVFPQAVETHAESKPKAVEAPAEARQATGNSGTWAAPISRILLIDDEPAIGEVITQGLEAEHRVEAVTSGADALELLAGGHRFDLIFCDLMMPGMTGPDVYAAIRRDYAGLEKRMVFMTGGAFTERARQFLAEIPNQRLEKPFTIRFLRQFLREVLPTFEESAEGPQYASKSAGEYNRG